MSGSVARVQAAPMLLTQAPVAAQATAPVQKLTVQAFTQNLTLGPKADDKEDEAALAEATIQAKADAIDSYFKGKGMPLAGTGKKMVLEAEKNGLDWRLVAAISVRESTGGKQACIRVPNNAFGWGSCKIGFKTMDAAIETVARNLGGNNPKTATHYDNKSTLEILRAYNPPSIVPKYAEQVIAIMNTIGDENLGAQIEA